MASTKTDLGGNEDILKLERIDPLEERRRQRLARQAVLRVVGENADDILQMLGLVEYQSAERERNKTPIKHGQRSGYTNRGCGRPGSPPCPATPSCIEKNAEYYRLRRRAA